MDPVGQGIQPARSRKTSLSCLWNINASRGETHPTLLAFRKGKLIKERSQLELRGNYVMACLQKGWVLHHWVVVFF